MGPFDHYLYVLACGDGSLYTGYTVDVAARVAAHQAGTGAKYTRAHAPVRLLAQARFFSKSRAMSAEALFKRLPREGKDALLAQAEHEPFEDVLRRELPGFGEDTASEFVCRGLAEHVDPTYRAFMAKLIPTVDTARVAGVRTPDLRRLAKQVARREDIASFLDALPHRLFEENQVHAFVLGLERDYDAALARYERFLPYVDNWATCDQLPVQALGARPGETLEHVERWLASGRCYTVRFAIGVLMGLFLDERFERRHLEMVVQARLDTGGEEGARALGAAAADGATGAVVAATADGAFSSTDGVSDSAAGRAPSAGPVPVAPPKAGLPAACEPASDAYYVNMMRAWYFAEALAKQEQAALPYFMPSAERPCAPGRTALDEWTRRKAIQKAIESRRIAPELKDRLRSWR